MGAKKMLAAALAFSVAATSIPLPGGVVQAAGNDSSVFKGE